MKTGVADLPLHYGRAPSWLFGRMKNLSRGIVLAIVGEFGGEELLRRFSDPVWFQSLGCVLGFDWNSSGLTTTVMAAVKEGLEGLEKDLGLFICGGKGKTSRKTPEQIRRWGGLLSWPTEKMDNLVYASKMAAKVDTACLQDGFQVYHHNFVFTDRGSWAIVQQGMNQEVRRARRYHWLSFRVRDFIEEPHSGIISGVKTRPLNLTAKESFKNKEISTSLILEEPQTFLKDFKLILSKSNSLMKQKRFKGFTEMELEAVEFHWHPVLREKFDLKRLEKAVERAHFLQPKGFEELLAIRGVGPKTIRALSLVAELIYGAKPSFEDPARYSFAVGGKDGTPFFVRKDIYDDLLDIMEKGIKKSQTSHKEKEQALRRLAQLISGKEKTF